MIKNFNHIDEIKPFLHQFYRPIFKLEMMRMCQQREQWPEMFTYDDFNRYFLVDIHTNVVHLG